MELKEKDKLVREMVNFPVRYDKNHQTILDAKGRLVCDIRGWENTGYRGDSEERQEALGEKISRLLNEIEGDREQCPSEIPEETSPLLGRRKTVDFEWD